MADGTGGADGNFDNGDTLIVQFAPDTNKANLPNTGITKRQIDEILKFSVSLGAGYTGQWLDAGRLRITIVNAVGAGPPLRGIFIVTCVAAGASPIRNIDQISKACSTSSPPLLGDFGATRITFTSTAKGDSNPVFSAGDSINIAFTADTDRAFHGTGMLNKTTVDRLFVFSQSLGADYTGRWLTRANFSITMTDATGSAPPTIGGLVVSVPSSSNLRNFPSNSAPLVFSAVPLAGDFGPNPLTIVALTARDPTDSSPVYNNGDRVTFTFSEDTNMGGYVIGQILPQSALAALVTFSVKMGNTLSGIWLSRRELEITAADVTGSGVPIIGQLTGTILATGNLRNNPPASAPASITSPTLVGNFGPSPIRIRSAVADDPTDLNAAYNNGDTLTITFTEATNKADLPDTLTKAQVDSLLQV